MKKNFLIPVLCLFAFYVSPANAQEIRVVPAIHNSETLTSVDNTVISPSPIQSLLLPKEITGNPSGGGHEMLAPPQNDNCSAGLNSINTLLPNAGCTSGTVSGAGSEAGEIIGCLTNGSTSVWYSFVATQSNMYITVQSTGVLVCSLNFGIVVWRYNGTCPPSTSYVGCKNYSSYGSGPGQEVFSNLNLTGLTVGATYIFQINYNTGCPNNTKQFCVSVGIPTTCSTCSNSCGPLCVYNGSSSPTVSWVTANCPSYPLRAPMNNSDNRTMCFTFTAANSTMNLQMVLSGWGCPIGGNVYSASYTLQTSSCGSVIASGTLSSGFPPMTGLTVGQNYVLCYTWQAACSLDSNYPFVWASSTLPIELVAFDAKANRDEVDVFWTTASEINTSEFVIERTNNGQDFTEIKRLHAAGNSTSILNYKVKDGNPVEGNNYYRLKEIDFDGTVTSGKLVVTRFTKNYSKISVMPNPAQNEIAVNFFADKDALVKISIVDAKGLVVLIKNVLADNDGANNIPVNISGLQPGIYSVCFLDADKNINTRFIKQ